MQQAEQGSSFDDMMNTLAAAQRRKLLFELLERDPQSDPPVVIGDSDAETDAVADSVTMRHVHAPKLAEHGFIEWDKDTREINRGPDFGDIEPLLELLDEHRIELPPDLS